MTLRRATVRGFGLPLTRPLDTAHGAIDRRRGFLVTIADDSGRSGYGEATPLPEFGTESAEACRAALSQALTPSNLAAGEDALACAVESGTPCARSAIDGALADLEARRGGASLAAWIRGRTGRAGNPLDRVGVQALVGGADPAAVASSAQSALEAGYRAFKLKLAVSPARRDLTLDLDRVASLREVVGPKACVRLDANEAWERAEAERALAALAVHAIDFVEQPVARGDLAALAALSRSGVVPIAADESLLGDGGWKRALEAGAASVFILKPAALGGITPATEVWRRATEANVRIVWSTLIDGGVGRAMPLALAAALGEPDDVQGLGTAGLLAEDFGSADLLDPARGLDPDGRWPIAPGAGIGFEPSLTLRVAETDSDFEVEA